MIILGSNSEVAQAFLERLLLNGEKFDNVYLFTSNRLSTEKFARHIEVKYGILPKIIELDLEEPLDFERFGDVDSQVLFCATGYLGKNTREGFLDAENTRKVIDINYAKLIPVINYFVGKMMRKKKGTIIGISSVAGDRGRQSNFIYGSSKAAFTAYLSGLRNYLYFKNIHVLTIKPGFMATKMTEGLALNPKLTATPVQAADIIYKAYKKKRNVVYVLPVWWVIMMIIRNIPEQIFKKLKL
ncbi:MAG: SDR family NAD(P)-dependent oxidoreductase [Bergeyella sp.]|nr:SDR family NAD(P)-dependent oxidoreductase [Bergeyella sp.]